MTRDPKWDDIPPPKRSQCCGDFLAEGAHCRDCPSGSMQGRISAGQVVYGTLYHCCGRIRSGEEACQSCGSRDSTPDDINPKTLIGARKVDTSLLPSAGVIHGAAAMADGARKYGPYNWREKRVPARTYIAAAQRHLLAYLDGESDAPDSGVHHLGHVIGCCAILLDAIETGNLIDDRPVVGAAARMLARMEKAA